MARNIIELNTISLLNENLRLSQFMDMTGNERKEFFKLLIIQGLKYICLIFSKE